MKVLYIIPGRAPEERNIPDLPTVIADLIGGSPLAVMFPTDWAAILYNPRAVWQDAELNFQYKGVRYYGPMLIVGMKQDRHVSLTKEQVDRYQDLIASLGRRV